MHTRPRLQASVEVAAGMQYVQSPHVILYTHSLCIIHRLGNICLLITLEIFEREVLKELVQQHALDHIARFDIGPLGSRYLSQRLLSGESLPPWLNNVCDMARYFALEDRNSGSDVNTNYAWYIALMSAMFSKEYRYPFHIAMLKDSDKSEYGLVPIADMLVENGMDGRRHKRHRV